MNRLHRIFCRSEAWRSQLQQRLLPWVLGCADLGDDLLEIGPGPGLATEALRERTAQLTSIEVDARLAQSLTRRMRDTNVEVVHGDATETSFEAGRFSGAVCFTMLHHVPSPELQDRLLREVHRVLRPGALFAGSDSVSSRLFEWMHCFDTLVPVDPARFGARLEAAGFEDVRVDARKKQFRFRGRKAQ
jgi:SAM-dependent methyltransferase